jgi:hypothetical protein
MRNTDTGRGVTVPLHTTVKRGTLAAILRQVRLDASIDEVITRLLDEHADQLLRAQMRADAAHARTNADDLAEVQRIQTEMDEISAW